MAVPRQNAEAAGWGLQLQHRDRRAVPADGVSGKYWKVWEPPNIL